MGNLPEKRVKHDLIRRPLDAVLAREANVRLLRLLSTEVHGPVNAEEAARRTGLTAPGARKGFERLVQTGFVRRVGGGRSQQFELNSGDSLVQAVAVLFRAEEDRYDDLLKDLRARTGDIPEIKSAWIDRLPSGPGEPIEATLVVEPTALPWIGGEIRARLAEVERRFDQIIEVRTFTEIDAPTPNFTTSIPLAGVVPVSQGSRAGRPRLHADADQRSRDLARGVAELMREDPSLIVRARRYLDQQLRDGRGTATADLFEWRQILDSYTPERLRQFLVSSSPRADRLRASSPFSSVLTDSDRQRLAPFSEDQDEPR